MKKKEEAFPRHPVVQQLPINSTSVPPPLPRGDGSPSGSRRTNIRRCCLCLLKMGLKSKGPGPFSSASHSHGCIFSRVNATVSEADQRGRPVPLISEGGGERRGGLVGSSSRIASSSSSADESRRGMCDSPGLLG